MATPIQNRIEKLKKEIDNARYFIIHASCKETKGMYQQALLEKEEELKLLLLQQLPGKPGHK
jgi:hypothetical protein